MKIKLRNMLVSDKIHELGCEKRKIEDTALLDGRELNDQEQLEIQEIEKKISYMEAHSERTYVAPFIEFGLYKYFFEIKEKITSGEIKESEMMEVLIDFTCKVFGDQFTEEEFLRGIRMSNLSNTLTSVYKDVELMINEGIEQDTQY